MSDSFKNEYDCQKIKDDFMAKKTRKGHRNPNATTAQIKPPPAKASDLFMGIAQVIMQGTFPATLSKLVVQAIDTLEFFANIERAKENDPNKKQDENTPEKTTENAPEKEPETDPELDELEAAFKEHDEGVKNEQEVV